MATRPAAPQRSANAGELSRDAAGRVDIKQYYDAALAMKNYEPVPQGGFRLMGGTARKGRWRKPLTGLSITGASLSAGPHTGTQTVWTGTVAGAPAAVLVTGLSIGAGTATFIVEAQRASDSAWVQIGIGNFSVAAATGAVTRLAAFAPGAAPVATALRIRATFSTSSTVAISSVAASIESGTAVPPRYVPLTTDEGAVLSAFLCAGIIDFYTNASGHVGAAWLPDVTAPQLPDIGFYAESRTMGIFHSGLRSKRVLLANPFALNDWKVDDWPFEHIPQADLGGSYATTADVWDCMVRFVNTPFVAVVVTVDGNSTPAIYHRDGGVPLNSGSWNAASWLFWAAEIETAINALPSMPGGATVSTTSTATGATGAGAMTISFAGASAGREFDLTVQVVNTSDASALVYRTQSGETEKEDLFSVARGWPGLAALVQDRMTHGRIPAQVGAITFSRAGEYFDFDDSAADAAAARIDKLRTQTSEVVLAIVESQYPVFLTDRGGYFSPNRAIDHNVPLNLVKASETGVHPNCEPFELDGVLHYVGIHPKGILANSEGGRGLFSYVYDEVSTKYSATPVALLATHLVEKIIRSKRQRAETDQDAPRGWIMRTDGRLIAGHAIHSQDILGFCEWLSADGGLVREIGVDGANRLWMAVERGSECTIEIYDVTLWLQDAVTATPDLAGLVSGLSYPNGTQLWAVSSTGYVLGPFTCTGGVINLEDSYAAVTVGRWQAPRFECMPQVRVLPSEDVLLRPGRISTAHINVIDTTSIAVGANGTAPTPAKLARFNDAEGPTPARTEMLTVGGEQLLGTMTGTTLVITQTRPGACRVRDYALETRL